MDAELITLDPKSPTGIAGVDKAKLPQIYEQAKRDLAECMRVDEVLEWQTKAAAMAAYAKMMNDRELEKLFKAVRQHATRRYGELQKLVANRRGGDRKSDQKGEFPRLKKTSRQTEQDRTAARFAAVSEPEFEEAVSEGKSDHAIAKMGQKPRKAPAAPSGGINPKSDEYKNATKLLALIDRTRTDAKNLSFEKAINGMSDEERDIFAEQVQQVADWYAGMVERLADVAAQD